MGPVQTAEQLSRFLIERKKFSVERRRVKYNAFMPSKSGEVSVFRTSGQPDDEIWDIGDREVAPAVGKPVLGRADLAAKVATDLGLRIDPAEPPPRHANIVGWAGEQSAKQLQAMKLAEESTLVVRPVPHGA